VQREAQVRQPLGQKAEALDCDYIATAITPSSNIIRVAPFAKGLRPRKDQSYFMSVCGSRNCGARMTPLGRDVETRHPGDPRSLSLKVADKVDSQEICFVPGNDYKAFLRSHLARKSFMREIYDLEGNFLGEHAALSSSRLGSTQRSARVCSTALTLSISDPETNRVSSAPQRI